jgi:hypothetical protein
MMHRFALSSGAVDEDELAMTRVLDVSWEVALITI